MTPRRRLAVRGSPRRRAASARSSVSARRCRARATTSSPARVGRTRRRSRSNRRTPSADSSWASCALSEGWDTPQSAAALPKLRAAATATAYCSCRVVKGCGASRFAVIVLDYDIYTNVVLDLSVAGQHRTTKEAHMLTIGDKFPAFKLKAAVSLDKGKEFQDVTSEEYPGKWKVVFFWPKD